MNKLLVTFKYLLLCINMLLFIIFCKKIGFEGFMLFIYIIILLFLFLVSIKDLIRKKNIGNKYNFLCIISFLIINLIFLRSLFDTNFIYNSSYHVSLLNKLQYYDNFKVINFMYIYQNLPYYIVMMMLLLIYRELNLNDKRKSKYSLISIICFIISLYTVIPTIELFNNTNINELGYFILNLILVSSEIFCLIKYNHKKREWLIYLSFLFNLFAFISIFV